MIDMNNFQWMIIFWFAFLPPHEGVGFLLVRMNIGSMKSARDESLARVSEFAHEIFAQYLITGKIKFNSFPKTLIVSNKQKLIATYETDLEIINNDLENYAEEIENNIEMVLSRAVGKIFVM